MIISGKRKRVLDKYTKHIKEGASLIVGVPVTSDTKRIVLQMGFTKTLNDGETVLPPHNFGPICNYNAEGKFLKRKDLPMETAYRQVEWTWEQWCGYRDTETRSKIVDVPYQRYQRTFIPPPSIELSLASNSEGIKYIISPQIDFHSKNATILLHIINIFLEIFGFCEILSKNLDGYVMNNYKRLNWEILPPGKWPWTKVKDKLDPIIEKASPKNQTVIRYRLQSISKFSPQFVALGRAGFYGYLIFGFPRLNLYVLESTYTGNATYVFEKDWEELSKMTKAQILEDRLQKDRIIHRENWEKNIDALLSKTI